MTYIRRCPHCGSADCIWILSEAGEKCRCNDCDNKVVIMKGLTTLDLPVGRVLNAALGADLERVIVLGSKNGETHFASSQADLRAVAWQLQCLLCEIYSGAYGHEKN